jgi:hypothetical protein
VVEPKRYGVERIAEANGNERVEIVIALGKRVYRCYRRSPELLAFDPSTLWQIISDSCGDDAEAEQLLAEFKDSSDWALAVLTAKVMHDAYVAGGLDEDPADLSLRWRLDAQ